MIDLDLLESVTGTDESNSKELLYVNLGLHLCSGSLTCDNWIRLTRWLGVANYVLPRDRVLLRPLFDTLLDLRWPDVFAVGLLKGTIESSYTETQQVLLNQIIQKSIRHARLKNAIIANAPPHYSLDLDNDD